MTVYPPLTKEEFTHFLKYEKDWGKMYEVPMPLITSPLTRRVGRSLHYLAACKFHGMFGYEENREEALSHYDKASIYDLELVMSMERTRTFMERYRHEQNSTSKPNLELRNSILAPPPARSTI